MTEKKRGRPPSLGPNSKLSQEPPIDARGVWDDAAARDRRFAEAMRRAIAAGEERAVTSVSTKAGTKYPRPGYSRQD